MNIFTLNKKPNGFAAPLLVGGVVLVGLLVAAGFWYFTRANVDPISQAIAENDSLLDQLNEKDFDAKELESLDEFATPDESVAVPMEELDLNDVQSQLDSFGSDFNETELDGLGN